MPTPKVTYSPNGDPQRDFQLRLAGAVKASIRVTAMEGGFRITPFADHLSILPVNDLTDLPEGITRIGEQAVVLVTKHADKVRPAIDLLTAAMKEKAALRVAKEREHERLQKQAEREKLNAVKRRAALLRSL